MPSTHPFKVQSSMRLFFPILICVLVAGCAVSSPQKTQPVYVYQTVQPQECVLAETGPVKDRSAHSFKGKVREVDPQVYACAVEIPMSEFESKLGYCALSGHNYAAGYEFFKGKPGTRRHSCDARPLKNGNFYFQSVGIDQDSCEWVCFPQAAK